MTCVPEYERWNGAEKYHNKQDREDQDIVIKGYDENEE